MNVKKGNTENEILSWARKPKPSKTKDKVKNGRAKSNSCKANKPNDAENNFGQLKTILIKQKGFIISSNKETKPAFLPKNLVVKE